MTGTIEYKPANATSEKQRVEASVWSQAPGGGLFVIPLDGGPRRFVRVRRIRWVWTEWTS